VFLQEPRLQERLARDAARGFTRISSIWSWRFSRSVAISTKSVTFGLRIILAMRLPPRGVG